MTRSHAVLAVLALLLGGSLMVCPSTAQSQEAAVIATMRDDFNLYLRFV